MHGRRLLPILLWGAVGCAPDAPPSLESHQRPIIGGEREAGHPAVGALVFRPDGAYLGSLCTGTLVAPTWVLTAAHCTEGLRDSGQNPAPGNLGFYVGDDARPEADNQPPATGAIYGVAAVHIHPDFELHALFQTDDIALIELSEPVPGVAPYALPAPGDEPEGDLLYVGFGVEHGVTRQGGGVKRRVTLPVLEALGPAYLTDHDPGGVCFGDSGGPGLRAAGDTFVVLGVNSSVASGPAGEPTCLGISIQTQVDAYVTWLHTTMGAGGTCQDGLDCACPEACGADGACDAYACNAGGCLALSACVDACAQEPGCMFACWTGSTRAAQRRFERLVNCAQRQCGGGGLECVEARCAASLDACNADFEIGPPGDAPCRAVAICADGCRDETCTQLCYAEGTAAARVAFDDLAACEVAECGREVVATRRRACVYERCAPAVLACAQPPACDLFLGGCPDGTACVDTPWGPDCAPSGGAGPGEACAPTETCNTTLCLPTEACGDTLVCVPLDAEPECALRCVLDSDCPENGRCDRPLGAQFGGCGICDDGDGDGDCDDTDCAPDDETRFHGASERCGDAIDQDCDGVDPACEPDLGPDQGVADGGPDEGPDEGGADFGVEPDAIPPDAGAADPGAADIGPVDAAAPAPDADDGGVVRTGSSGGCQAAPGGGPPALALLLALIGLSRRRR